MFYNMKIKTLRRNRDIILQKIRNMKESKLHQISIILNLLIKQKLDIEKITHNNLHESSEEEDLEQSYGAKYDQLNNVISLKTEEISIINELTQKSLEIVNNICKDMISIVKTELNNGGNIKLEEGNCENDWYTNVSEIIKDKFEPEIFKKFGITDYNIKRIWKIENKYCKNRFEDKIIDIIKSSNEKIKTTPEYLFYGELPQEYMKNGENKEIIKIIQEGFKSSEEYLQSINVYIYNNI